MWSAGMAGCELAVAWPRAAPSLKLKTTASFIHSVSKVRVPVMVKTGC